jgi:putative transcriptional regulator
MTLLLNPITKRPMNILPNTDLLPTKGQVLLSEPFLNDPYFRRTVVFLCEHNAEGSFGFVLNNYIDVELEQIMDNMPAFEGRISIGGPVRNSNLYYLHTLGNLIEESVEVIPGIFMGGNFENLKTLLQAGKVQKNDVRFFVGYSGWSPTQLEEEIKLKSWFVANVSKETVMNSDNDDLWKSILKTMGSKGKFVAGLPEDPSLN